MKLIERIQRFKPKRIYVFENGYCDCFVDHSVTINPKRNPTWNSVLYHITTALKPHFSTVERLVNRHNCTSVHSFSDLIPNEKYIACGKPYARLIPGCYKTRSEVRIRKEPDKDEHEEPNLDWTLQQARKNKRKIIFVFANGRKKQVPIKFVLTGRDMLNWESTLNYMSIMLDMPKGIYNVYTTYGKNIYNPVDLQHGASYVVSSYNDKFEDLAYLDNYEKYLTEKSPLNVDKSGDKGENNSVENQDANLAPSVHVMKRKRSSLKKEPQKNGSKLPGKKIKEKNGEGMDRGESFPHEEQMSSKPTSKSKSKRDSSNRTKNSMRSSSSQSTYRNTSDNLVKQKCNELCSSCESVMIIDNLNENHYADVSVQTIPKSLHSMEAPN